MNAKKILLLTFLPTLLAAQSWKNEVNIPKTGALKKMPPTHLTYNLSWNGKLKAGTLDFVFGKKDPRYPKHYVCQAYGGSTGWARGLYPFSFNYISFLRPSSMRPNIFIGNETEKGKLKQYRNRFQGSKVTSTKSSLKDGKKSPESKKTYQQSPCLDPFAALLQIRSLPLTDKKTYIMPFFPVGKPYLARVTVLGREKFKERDTIKLLVKLQKIGPNNEIVPYKKLKSATLWITDDEWRIPLELRAKVYVGDVRMRLTSQK